MSRNSSTKNITTVYHDNRNDFFEEDKRNARTLDIRTEEQ